MRCAVTCVCSTSRTPAANHLSEFVCTTTWSATPPAVNIEDTRRQAMRQNDREVRHTIIRVLSRRLARTASFDGASFSGKDTSFDDARFAGEYVSFRRVGFSSQTTAFGKAVFKCLRASFDSSAEWKKRRVRLGQPAERNPAGRPALHHAATVAAVPGRAGVRTALPPGRCRPGRRSRPLTPAWQHWSR
jgi:hypothetical protein